MRKKREIPQNQFSPLIPGRNHLRISPSSKFDTFSSLHLALGAREPAQLTHLISDALAIKTSENQTNFDLAPRAPPSIVFDPLLFISFWEDFPFAGFIFWPVNIQFLSSSRFFILVKSFFNAILLHTVQFFTVMS
jgi:hypothetical protein